MISAIENNRAQKGEKKSQEADSVISENPTKKVIHQPRPTGSKEEPGAHLGGKCNRQPEQQVQRP